MSRVYRTLNGEDTNLVCLTRNETDWQCEPRAALGNVSKGPPKCAACPDTHRTLVHQTVSFELYDLQPHSCLELKLCI